MPSTTIAQVGVRGFGTIHLERIDRLTPSGRVSLIATADPGPVETSLGFTMNIDEDLTVAADADLIAVPAHHRGRVDERYLDVIRAAEARGAWVLSVCSGAFVLAQGCVFLAATFHVLPLPAQAATLRIAQIAANGDMQVEIDG